MSKILVKIMKMFGINYHKPKRRNSCREWELLQKMQQLHYTTDEERAQREEDRREMARLGLVTIIK